MGEFAVIWPLERPFPGYLATTYVGIFSTVNCELQSGKSLNHVIFQRIAFLNVIVKFTEQLQIFFECVTMRNSIQVYHDERTSESIGSIKFMDCHSQQNRI
jgi:hypothetical protein